MCYRCLVVMILWVRFFLCNRIHIGVENSTSMARRTMTPVHPSSENARSTRRKRTEYKLSCVANAVSVHRTQPPIPPESALLVVTVQTAPRTQLSFYSAFALLSPSMGLYGCRSSVIGSPKESLLLLRLLLLFAPKTSICEHFLLRAAYFY